MRSIFKHATLLICLLLPSWVSQATESEEPIHVVFLNPAAQDYWFWHMITDFMQASADDLNIKLEVLYNEPKWNHFLTIRQAEEVVKRKNPPDYILTGNEKGSAGGVIRVAQQAGVKVFVFNNGFVDPVDIEHYGKPREKYSMWIGQLIPNNFSAGYQIAKTLITQAMNKKLVTEDSKLHLAALAGAFNTHASTERVKGLEAAVTEHQGIVQLVQIVPGDWTEKTAEKKSLSLLNRYPNIGAVWGANDVTAFGAMTSARAIGKEPGVDIIFGGCGWSAEAIEKVHQNTLATTVGGHFMDGGWALVMLYDYHHGRDFNDDIFSPNMYAIDSRNVEQYLTVFGKQDWSKIDFRQFSKTLNPKVKSYDFSLEAVLKQFK